MSWRSPHGGQVRIPAPWQQHWCPKAQQWYFFNPETQRSTWEIPAAQPTLCRATKATAAEGLAGSSKRRHSPERELWRVDRDYDDRRSKRARSDVAVQRTGRQSGERSYTAASVRKVGSARADRGRTYLPLMEQMDPEVLSTALGPGWTAVDFDAAFDAGYVDLVFLDGFKNFERRLWKLKCGTKSRIDAQSISVKTKLHQLLTNHCPHMYIPETIVLDGSDHRMPPGVWIFRPERKEGSGAGIAVVQTQAELEAAIKADRRDNPKNRIAPIISKYIDRPLLLEQDGELYKFHLRIYYLVVVFPDRARNRAALYFNGEIARAKRPYVREHYWNRDSHDTHLSDSFTQSRPLVFPQDFPGDAVVTSSVFRGIHACLTDVTRLAVPDLAPYTECSDRGFNLFGCDFMVDESGKVQLIEINGTPGLQRKGFGSAVYSAFSQFIIGGIHEFALVEVDPIADKLQHVIPCDELGVAILDADCEGILARGTAEFAEAAGASQMSELVGAGAGAKNTIVFEVRDAELERAVRDRLEPAGWKFLTFLQAFSSKHTTAVLVSEEHGHDKRIKRIEYSVSNLLERSVEEELTSAVQMTQPKSKAVISEEVEEVVIACILVYSSSQTQMIVLTTESTLLPVSKDPAQGGLRGPIGDKGNSESTFSSLCQQLDAAREYLRGRIVPADKGRRGIIGVNALFRYIAGRPTLSSLVRADFDHRGDRSTYATAICEALGVREDPPVSVTILPQAV